MGGRKGGKQPKYAPLTIVAIISCSLSSVEYCVYLLYTKQLYVTAARKLVHEVSDNTMSARIAASAEPRRGYRPVASEGTRADGILFKSVACAAHVLAALQPCSNANPSAADGPAPVADRAPAASPRSLPAPSAAAARCCSTTSAAAAAKRGGHVVISTGVVFRLSARLHTKRTTQPHHAGYPIQTAVSNSIVDGLGMC